MSTDDIKVPKFVTVGDFLRDLREIFGNNKSPTFKNQTTLGEFLGKSRFVVGNYEKEKGNPDVEYVAGVAYFVIETLKELDFQELDTFKERLRIEVNKAVISISSVTNIFYTWEELEQCAIEYREKNLEEAQANAADKAKSEPVEEVVAASVSAPPLRPPAPQYFSISSREQELEKILAHIHQSASPPDFVPPFIDYRSSKNFFGRESDLKKIHELLQGKSPVGIRPMALSGLGGIGKTQLAIEYAYRNSEHYPSGIFWLNASGNLTEQFATIARYLGVQHLGVEIEGKPQDIQANEAWKYLNRHRDALVVLDNVVNVTDLNIPFLPGLVPAALSCHLLFTTRQRDFESEFIAFEVKVLPEDAAMQLLLHHETRQTILEPHHPEYGIAQNICAMVGYLPLALALAAAFLGKYPKVSLTNYRTRLIQRGVLETVDESKIRPEQLPTRHDTAIQSTLQISWSTLTDENARLLLRSAGQLSQAEAIPIARLGLLTGLPLEAEPGYPSLLEQSLKELSATSLMEESKVETVQLHPLVFEFAKRLTPEDKDRNIFCNHLADNILNALENLETLEAHTARRGVDEVLGDLRTALKLYSQEASKRKTAISLERLLDREAHHLRKWNRQTQPYYFAQRLHAGALRLGILEIRQKAQQHLMHNNAPYLRLSWRVGPQDTNLLRTIVGHTDHVLSVVVTPDGKQVISGSGSLYGNQRVIKVWDFDTGREIRTFEGHDERIEDLAITPDGKKLVSASRDHTLKVWNLETGQELLTLKGHEDQVLTVIIFRNGTRVASGSRDETVRIWNLETGEEIYSLNGHYSGVPGFSSYIFGLAVTPDETKLISASRDCTIKVWDLGTFQEIRTLEGHRNFVEAVAVTPDGKQLISASWDWTLKIWDLETGQEIRTIEEHEGPIYALALTPDGKKAVSGSSDKTLRLWDLGTGQEIASFEGHTKQINAIDIVKTSDGLRVVSASEDYTLKVWDLEPQKLLSVPEMHTKGIKGLAVTPDRKKIVSVSEDTTIKVWGLKTGTIIRTIKSHYGPLAPAVTPFAKWKRHFVITPDGGKIVSVAYHNLKVWELETGRQLRILTGHRDNVIEVALIPGSSQVISASWDNHLMIWDLESNEGLHFNSSIISEILLGTAIPCYFPLIDLEGHVNRVEAIEVTADGRKAVSGASDCGLIVWDLEEGEGDLLLEHSSSVEALAITPDGTKVVSGSDDDTVKVWNIETREEIYTLKGHEQGINDVLITSDGKLVVSRSFGVLKVWNLVTGQELHTFEIDNELESVVALTPDGRRVISAAKENMLKVWDLITGQEIASFIGDCPFESVIATQSDSELWVIAGDKMGTIWGLELLG